MKTRPVFDSDADDRRAARDVRPGMPPGQPGRSPEIRGRRDPAEITGPVTDLIAWVEDVAGVPVSSVDTGKGASDVIDLGI